MGDRADLDVQVKGAPEAIVAIGFYLRESYGMSADVDDLPEGLGSWHDGEMSLGTDVEIANWLDTEHPSVSYLIGQGARYEYLATCYLKVPSIGPAQRFSANVDDSGNVLLTEAQVVAIDSEATDDADFRQGVLKACGVTLNEEWRELAPKAPWTLRYEALQAEAASRA